MHKLANQPTYMHKLANLFDSLHSFDVLLASQFALRSLYRTIPDYVASRFSEIITTVLGPRLDTSGGTDAAAHKCLALLPFLLLQNRRGGASNRAAVLRPFPLSAIY